MPAGWKRDPVISALGEERVLWSHDVKTGWLRQTVVKSQIITNLRVSEGIPVMLKDIDAIIVANKREVTEQSGSSFDYSYPRSQGSYYRPTHYDVKSTSKTFGDVIFMRDGRAEITFQGIEDPDGVADIARAARSNILDVLNSVESKAPQNSQEPCRKCNQPNPPGSKFCNNCGSKLADGCPKCGRENPAEASFCGGCGAPLS